MYCCNVVVIMAFILFIISWLGCVVLWHCALWIQTEQR